MAGRMSNRDRIAHAALEAAATSKDKAKAESLRKASPTKRKTASRAKKTTPVGRTRIVWAVCSPSGATVETYPYPKEAEARAEAERLTEEKGRPHFVKRDEVPFE